MDADPQPLQAAIIHLPPEWFLPLVIGSAIVAGIITLKMVFDPRHIDSPSAAHFVMALVFFAWIAGMTWWSVDSGNFWAVLNFAPIYVIQKMRGS